MACQSSVTETPWIKEWKGDYYLTNDPSDLSSNQLLALYQQTYWANNRPLEVIEKSLAHSLCYMIYHQEQVVGFMRFVTDYATFAYMCDVIIDEEHRKKGLSKWMVGTALSHPEIRHIRRISLMTQDAHTLYEPFGFKQLEDPKRYMEKMNDGGQL